MPDVHYTAHTTTPAFSLRWSWTGWPSQGSMPTLNELEWLELTQTWEKDGIRVLERKCTRDQWQATVSTRPDLTPVFIVNRMKGRIDYFFRSRNTVSLRAIGHNRSTDVQEYIAKQVASANFCDTSYANALAKFTRVWREQPDWNDPLEVNSGRYWYQLHVVLVVDDRHRIRDMSFLHGLFEESQSVCANREYRLGAISVMPDHLHLSLRGVIADSPETIAIGLMNETYSRLQVNSLWKPSYYVGTCGGYNMNAVRA
jgi:REP element-mobilizing transposase RayT